MRTPSSPSSGSSWPGTSRSCCSRLSTACSVSTARRSAKGTSPRWATGRSVRAGSSGSTVPPQRCQPNSSPGTTSARPPPASRASTSAAVAVHAAGSFLPAHRRLDRLAPRRAATRRARRGAARARPRPGAGGRAAPTPGPPGRGEQRQPQRDQRRRLVRRPQELDGLDVEVQPEHRAAQRRAVREADHHEDEPGEHQQQAERPVAPAARQRGARRARRRARAASRSRRAARRASPPRPRCTAAAPP